MVRSVLCLMCLLALTTLAHAEVVLCGDATALVWFRLSADPTKTPACPAPFSQVVISKANTAGQRAILEGTDQAFLRIVSDLATLKAQGDIDAILAQRAAAAAAQTALQEAVTNNDLCNATLAELETRKDQLLTNLQSDIDGISTIATAKTELADMMQRLVGALEKVLRCVRGRAG